MINRCFTLSSLIGNGRARSVPPNRGREKEGVPEAPAKCLAAWRFSPTVPWHAAC